MGGGRFLLLDRLDELLTGHANSQESRSEHALEKFNRSFTEGIFLELGRGAITEVMYSWPMAIMMTVKGEMESTSFRHTITSIETSRLIPSQIHEIIFHILELELVIMGFEFPLEPLGIEVIRSIGLFSLGQGLVEMVEVCFQSRWVIDLSLDT